MNTSLTAPARSRGRGLPALGLAVVLVLGLAACGGDDDDDDQSAPSSTDAPTTSTGDQAGDAAGGSTGAVPYEITGISFTDVTASPGGVIDIANSSGAPHTFTADDGSFDAQVAAGETATVTAPTAAGEYAFHCEVHSSMQATLTVEG